MTFENFGRNKMWNFHFFPWSPVLEKNNNQLWFDRCNCLQNISLWRTVYPAGKPTGQWAYISKFQTRKSIDIEVLHNKFSRKWPTFLQTISSNVVCSMIIFIYWFKFHWRLFRKTQAKILPIICLVHGSPPITSNSLPDFVCSTFLLVHKTAL